MASQLPVEPLCLHVLVLSASGLFKKDLFGLCDPYVKVTHKRKSKTLVSSQTKKKKKTLYPEWNEKFVFNKVNLSNDSLLFEVFDENKLTRDNFLGKLHFKLSHIPIEMKKLNIYQYPRFTTYSLKPRSHKSRVSGTLSLKFLYYNNPPPRVGSATLMGELNLASLVEGSTGSISPQPQRSTSPQDSDSPSLSTSSLDHQRSIGEEWSMENEEEPLPEGWEERQDANGRYFYVDHINRRTQWERPTRSAAVGAGQRRAQMEADRQRMLAQTLARSNPGMTGAESVLDLSTLSLNGSGRNSIHSSPSGPRHSALNLNDSISSNSSPSGPRQSVVALNDSTSTNHTNSSPSGPRHSTVALNDTNSTSTSNSPSGSRHSLSHSSISHSTPSITPPPPLPPRSSSIPAVPIPHLPPPPSSRQANSQANSRPRSALVQSSISHASSVTSLSPLSPTSSSSEDDELPEGWERRRASNGRYFYIDHNTRRTQWHKPPRPHPQSTIPPRPASTTPTSNGIPPVSIPSSGPTTPTSTKNLGPLPTGWEMRILPDGRKFFIEHATRSTQWEDPRLQQLKKQQASIPTHSRDYKVKYSNLRKYLIDNKPSDLPRIFEIPVRRQHIFEDSHRAIMNCKNKSHLKARLWVKFEGEKGLDYGGVSREWFFLLSHEMFNPYYGLFEYAASDNYTLQVNPESGFCNENHLEYFRFIGRIIAMAIYHQRLIDAFFVRPFYKMLTGKKIILSDMEMVDTEFYNSIKYILENDPEPLCLTFTANREFVGQVEEVELKPGGAEIDVTESNKKEYVDLLMKWRFENRITKQMDSLKKGFNEVISTKLLAPFDAQEIEYLMCGIGEINVEDWKNNTVYAAGYKPTDVVILWFWKTVTNFDNELRARLLQFVTGTSKVPMNGFAELQGSNGPQKFCIKKLGEPTSLPRSHTCFNRIDLPPYRSYHELKEKLRVAIENTEGFEGVD